MAAGNLGIVLAVFGIHPADPKTDGDLPEKLAIVQAADLASGRIVEEVCPAAGVWAPGRWTCRAVSTRRGNSRSAGGNCSRRAASKNRWLLNTLLCSGSPGAKKIVRSQAIFQRNCRRRNICQRRPNSCSSGRGCRASRATCHQERPFGQLAVLAQGAPADCRETKSACCPGKSLAAPGRSPAPCDGSRSPGTARPAPDEPHQGRQAPLVDRQPLGGEGAIVQQPVEVEGPGAIARHVGVAEHEIHVVDGVQAAEEAAQKPQPLRRPVRRLRLGPGDERSDLLGVERFVGVKRPLGLRRTPRIRSPNSRRMISLPSDFVVQAEIGQKMFVEKMSERAVARRRAAARPSASAIRRSRGWARRGKPLAGCRTARPRPGWPNAWPPARAGIACVRPWERPTRRSATGESAAVAAARGGR